jgi:hypothetical protein
LPRRDSQTFTERIKTYLETSMILLILIPMLILSVGLYISYTMSVARLVEHIKKLSIADLGSLSAFKYCEWYMLSNNSQFTSYIFHCDFPEALRKDARDALLRVRNLYFSFLACVFVIALFLLVYFTLIK